MKNFWRITLWLIGGGFLLLPQLGHAQSLEVMPGHEGVFLDVQFFKPVVSSHPSWTIFHRTRAQLDYEGNSDLLSAIYANYTTPWGPGLSVIGSVGNNGSQSALGLHYFKVKGPWTIFALVAVNIEEDPRSSFFSILRYRPALNDQWKLYSALELYALGRFDESWFRIQRIRVGLDRWKFQFGLAANLSQTGRPDGYNGNYGVFVRREF